MNLKLFDDGVLKRFPKFSEMALQIGQTRLIEVPNAPGSARIFAKCEWENPFGTVKDRAALAMIYQYMVGNKLTRPRILEYSGGSLAVALSELCCQLGIPFEAVVPSNFNAANTERLRKNGSKVHLVPKELGFWAVMQEAKRLKREDPSYYFLNQHQNSANLWIHEQTTGPEILNDLKNIAGTKQIDAWVASIGTGATLIGVYQALSQVNPQLALYATNPKELEYGSLSSPNGLPKFAGSGGLGEGRKQVFVKPVERKIQEHFLISYEESRIAMRNFYLETGMGIGSSAAANYLAAREIARRLGTGKIVVTVFPSVASQIEMTDLSFNLVPVRKNAYV